MTSRAVEANADGLIGPTHSYAGLSPGNLASSLNEGQASNPRAAVLQGLDKMKRLADLGLPQFVLPPHERPDIAFLRAHFGSQADYLYRAARGIDLRRVDGNRPRKSIGGERTFDRDISTGPALREALDNIIDIVWHAIEKHSARGRTVTLKLKLVDFTTTTRARSLAHAVAGKPEFARLGHALLDEVLPLPQPVRLMGLTLSALEGSPEQPTHSRDPQLSLL